jgi:hypothetical protein
MTSAAQPSPDGLVERDAELGPGGRTAPGREQTTPGAHRAGRQRRVTVAAWLGLHGRRAWDDALEAAAEVDDFSTGYQMDIVGPSPRGALVRRTAGSSDTPDSSQNTMAARRRRAPARILGPVLSHPTGDRPLVRSTARRAGRCSR